MLKGSEAVKDIFGAGLTFHTRHHFTALFMSPFNFAEPHSMHHLHYPLSHLLQN